MHGRCRGHAAPDVGVHRRRRAGRAGHGAAARPLRHRRRDRRKESDHDRSSQVARLLGAHHGDLPAVGHRAAHPRSRPAGQFRHVRAGREYRRARDWPVTARAEPRPDAGLEVPGGAGRGRGGVLSSYRAFELGAGALLDRVRRFRGGRGWRRLRDPLGRHRPGRVLARQVLAGLRWRRKPDAPPASRWSDRRRLLSC
jgi:hypothetical protein